MNLGVNHTIRLIDLDESNIMQHRLILGMNIMISQHQQISKTNNLNFSWEHWRNVKADATKCRTIRYR